MANASFLPEDYVQRRAARRTNLFLLVLFILVLGGVVTVFFFTDKQRHVVQMQQKSVNERFVEAARRIDQLDQLQAQRQQMLLKANIARVLVERMPRTRLFSELINNMPPTIIWDEVEIDTRVVQGAPHVTSLQKVAADRRAANAKGTLSEPMIERQQEITTVRIVAFAPTDIEVAAFMTGLGSNPLFNNVTLAFSEEKTIDERTVRSFRIDLEVRADVDVTEMTPKMVRRGGEGLPVNPMSGGQLRIEGDKVFTPKGPSAEVPTNNH